MRASVFIAVPAFAAAVFAQSVRLEARLEPLTTISLSSDVSLTFLHHDVTIFDVSALLSANVVLR